MSELAALKALSRETKALILVSEFEARRMPMFQMRTVLSAIIVNDEEKKVVIDLIERDLRATGYPAEQIATFLGELISASSTAPVPPGMDQSVQSTRRLRNPFALGFEGAGDENAAEPVPRPRGLTGVVQVSPSPPRPATGATPVRPAAAYNPIPPPDSGTPKAVPATSSGPGLRATGPAQAGAPRSTVMGFDAPRAPAPVAPAVPTAAVPPAAPAAPPKPAEALAPVGTAEWRQQMAFGKSMTSGQRERRPTVLIADDDKRIRMIFRMRVEEAGMAVVECGTGDEAWQRIQDGGLSLVVLDMKMPGLHGLEVLSAMADKQISLPIVVCSAYDQLQDEFVIRTHPQLKYLVKPVAPEALVAAVRELLLPKPQA